MAYLMAKARTRSKYLHSAMILPNAHGGVDLYILTSHGDDLLPFGSSWHESEAAAKADAAETMKIREKDWTSHDGQPQWAGAVRDAVDDAIKQYTRASEKPPGDGA